MWHKLRHFSLKPLITSQKWWLIPCLICSRDSRAPWSRHMSLIFHAWQWNKPFITHYNTCCTFKEVKPLGICLSVWRAHWFVMADDRLCHIIFVNSTHCEPLNKYTAPFFFSWSDGRLLSKSKVYFVKKLYTDKKKKGGGGLRSYIRHSQQNRGVKEKTLKHGFLTLWAFETSTSLKADTWWLHDRIGWKKSPA